MKERYWELKATQECSPGESIQNKIPHEIQAKWLEKETEENESLYADIILDYFLGYKDGGRYIEDQKGNAGWIFYDDVPEAEKEAYKLLFYTTQQHLGKKAADKILANCKEAFLSTAIAIKKYKAKQPTNQPLYDCTDAAFESLWGLIPEWLVFYLTAKEIAEIIGLMHLHYLCGVVSIKNEERLKNKNIAGDLLRLPEWLTIRLTLEEQLKIMEVLAEAVYLGISLYPLDDGSKSISKQILEVATNVQMMSLKIKTLAGFFHDFLQRIREHPKPSHIDLKNSTGQEEGFQQLLENRRIPCFIFRMGKVNSQEVSKLTKQVQQLPQDYQSVIYLKRRIDDFHKDEPLLSRAFKLAASRYRNLVKIRVKNCWTIAHRV